MLFEIEVTAFDGNRSKEEDIFSGLVLGFLFVVTEMANGNDERCYVVRHYILNRKII